MTELQSAGLLFLYLGFVLASTTAVVLGRKLGEVRQLLQSYKQMHREESKSQVKARDDARAKLAELKMAIREHQEAKGHNRCWLDDLELYKKIDPGSDKMNLGLPALPEFIHNCAVYWRDRQAPEQRKL